MFGVSVCVCAYKYDAMNSYTFFLTACVPPKTPKILI